jgi:hypothetical protein
MLDSLETAPRVRDSGPAYLKISARAFVLREIVGVLPGVLIYGH